MSNEKTYEMLWDCQYCGTKKLLGKTHRFCPNCGAAQDPKSRYYPSDEDKVAVEDHHFVGVDVTCNVCGTLNGADSKFCQNCGASLEEGVKAQTLAEQTRGLYESFESSGSRDVVKESFDAEMVRAGVKPKNAGAATSGLNMRVIAFVVVAIVLLGAAALFFLRTEERTVVVTGHGWEHTITVEEYVNFSESSWRDSRPAGYNVSMVPGTCVERQRGTRQVPDGQTCNVVRSDNGDGTFNEREVCHTNYRSEPVYDDWCQWSGERYTLDDTYTTSGLDLNTFWPQVSLNCANQQRIGCQREDRKSTYWITFKLDDGDQTYRCDFGINDWQAAEEGDRFTVQVRAMDESAADCGSLKPAS